MPFYKIQFPSIRIHKVNRIIGTISVLRDIVVLFCQWVLLEEDGGGWIVEPGTEVQEGLVGCQVAAHAAHGLTFLAAQGVTVICCCDCTSVT